jgi:hypothetical protein
MIRLFLDTEFTDFPFAAYLDDQRTVVPDYTRHCMISIAFYGGDDSTTFYRELSDFPKEHCSSFVVNRVLPLLYRDPSELVDRVDLRNQVLEFLCSFDEVELMFDSMYDWNLLSELIGVPLPHVRGCMIEGKIDRKKFYQFFKDHALINHHALADVKAQHHAYDPLYKSSAADAD